MVIQTPVPTYKSVPLDLSADAFGTLRSSDDIVDDAQAQRQRLEQDGYLYLPGYLGIDEIRSVRTVIFDYLAKNGILDPSFPSYEGICKPDAPDTLLDYRTDGSNEFIQTCEPLRRVALGGRVLGFWETFFGGPVTYFNHIWFRAKRGQSKPTPPHCDSLYMGRGTHNVFTTWIPYVDADYDMGGVMILEGSHRLEMLRGTYCKRDIDLYCQNSEDAEQIVSGEKVFQRTGEYSLDAIGTRAELQGRWLTAKFKMGDLLIFGIYTMHASCDNQTLRMRISSDTRYQSAAEPADERWVGAHPVGHGPGAKIGMIC